MYKNDKGYETKTVINVYEQKQLGNDKLIITCDSNKTLLNWLNDAYIKRECIFESLIIRTENMLVSTKEGNKAIKG